MSQSNSTNNGLTQALSALISASVEEQQKTAAIVKAIRDQKKKDDEELAILSQANNALVSKLQEELSNLRKTKKAKQDESYKTAMAANGMSAEVYPFEVAAAAVDNKMLTPVVSTVGKGVKQVVNAAQGIAGRFMLGFGKKAA